jgi:uracil-DNA glycosylase
VLHDWSHIVELQQQQSYFRTLSQFVERERLQHVVYPAHSDVYAALRLTPLEKTRVVLLGQDPYHGAGQAHGLSFSVPSGVALPPSLRNIMKERQADVGLPISPHGNLTAWAQQGVLLLNSTLTVREGEAGSHRGQGWETFTDALLAAVNAKDHRVVFVLWGSTAQQKHVLITGEHHVVLRAPHPSPLSAHRGFFGSSPFSQVNKALEEVGEIPIDWRNDINQ